MGNLINFMEKFGSSAEFQELTEAEAMALLKQEKLVSNEATAFHPTIEMLLDARKNLVCGIEPAEEPAEEPAKQPDDEPDEDSPKKDK